MGRFSKQIIYQIRYALPLWLAQMATGWMPDNRLTVRFRGILVALVLPRCGKRFVLGRDVTLLGVDRLVIGDDVYIAKGAWMNAVGGIKIGDEVMVGPYAVIASTNHGFKDGSVRFGGGLPAAVRIGRGSWVGAHVVVTAGVSIECGCIIGGNAVVTKDVPENMFAGGVPAKVIGPRGEDVEGIHNREDYVVPNV